MHFLFLLFSFFLYFLLDVLQSVGVVPFQFEKTGCKALEKILKALADVPLGNGKPALESIFKICLHFAYNLLALFCHKSGAQLSGQIDRLG